MYPYALTILLSAFLLFQVQPILGRFVLPWFGGGAGVWTTCMLFFQVLLLGGYAYAHLLNTKLKPRAQMVVHMSLLALALLFMPLLPRGAAMSAPDDGGSPVTAILLALTIQVGLPYFILSSTGPLLQAWFGRQQPGRSPYRLYALSNVGSLTALLTYPFLIEGTITLRAQGWSWTVGFGAFALLCGWIAVRFGTDKNLAPPQPIAAAEAMAVASESETAKQRRSLPEAETATITLSPSSQVLAWIGLSAIGSMMLLAVTNQLCLDLAPVPLLWVAPLAIYLITFIICFDRETWYRRIVFVPLLAISVYFVNQILHDRHAHAMWFQIAAFSSTLFAACMVCHGELVRLKPETSRLTSFYLSVSAGGAIGGFFVAVLAPIVFVDLWEFHLALLAACLVAVLCVCMGVVRNLPPTKQAASYFGGAALWFVLAFSLYTTAARPFADYTDNVRNFYGVLHLSERIDRINGECRELIHGTTRHGVQYFRGGRRRWPTSYYGEDSGAGLAVEFLAHPAGLDQPRQPVKLGVIGLGVGTMNAHLLPHDSIVYYEIDAEVERFARKYFKFIEDSRAETKVLLGDARVVLQRQADANEAQEFDLLCVDAFTSDSIPMHLITVEAAELYDRHIKRDTGVIAFHISNRYLDLLPVIRGLGEARGMKVIPIFSVEEPWTGASSALWVLLTRNEKLASDSRIRLAAELDVARRSIAWSDDFSSLRDVIYLGMRPRTGRWFDAPNAGRFVHDQAGMMTRQAARELQWKMRRLFAERGSQYPLQLVVDLRVPREQDPGKTAERYAAEMYRLYGLNQGQDKAVLLMVLKDDEQIRLELGAGWSQAAHERFEKVINEVVLPGMAQSRTPDEAAAALDRSMTHLAQLLQEEYARGR